MDNDQTSARTPQNAEEGATHPVGAISSVQHSSSCSSEEQAPPRTDADPALRAERIASLRSAIAEGRYHVSAAELAEKLIAHMLTNRPPPK